MMGSSTIAYSTSEALETWSMPDSGRSSELEDLGERYHVLREGLMNSESIGLTQLYNRFHDPLDLEPRIQALRALHQDIDLAVLRAYGWEDLELGHDFHPVPYLPDNDRIRFTLSERARLEVLRRLSELNHERYAQEVAQGLHGRTTGRIASRSSQGPRTTSSEPVQPAFDFDASPSPTSCANGPIAEVFGFLEAHRGWHARADILAGTNISDAQWKLAIDDLITSGKVERQGERRGARYRVRREGDNE